MFKIGDYVRSKIEDDFVRLGDFGIVTQVDDQSMCVYWNNPIQTRSNWNTCWFVYPTDVELCESKSILLQSDMLWILAKGRYIEENTLFRRQDEDCFIFTEKSFQVFKTNQKEGYVGMRVGDKWEIIGQYKGD